MAQPDPVRLEVFHSLLAAVCEEAGGRLQRSAVSPNIRERRDFSCAMFDREGRMVSQAAHIPVHLGSATDSVAAVRESLDLAPGDVAVLNDPYRGGTHLPDVTMVCPLFLAGSRRPDWYLVNRAHHADIGGSTPGSMGVAMDLIAEGPVLPPVLLRRRGVIQEGVMSLIRANVRGPDERILDFQAQEASLGLAGERLAGMAETYGQQVLQRYAGHLMDYAERIVKKVLREIPTGEFKAVDAMEDDGLGNGPFPIRLRLKVSRTGLTFDYRGSAPQAQGGINANPSIVLAAAIYVLRCLCPERLPTNEGLYRLVRVITEKGTIVDPRPPAAVAGGNVETSQRLVDLGLSALGKALPGRIPASSAGTMSNLCVGGEGFTFYETLPGGAGAGPAGPGASVLQTHMTNTRNTPIEELESHQPLRVTRLTVRVGSGGAGRHRGGDGLVKELEALAPMILTFLGERHVLEPAGAAGGRPGRTGRLTLVSKGRRRRLPAKTTVSLSPGDRVCIETPGGGGFGRP